MLIQRLKAGFVHLLAEAHRQVKALEQTITSEMSRVRTLAGLAQALDRLDRLAVLLVVYTTAPTTATAPTWDVTWQRWLADQLDALHGRAVPLLARGLPEGAIKVPRFATRLSALDPLASFRTGPDGLIDVAEKLIAGPAFRDAHHYRNREVIAGVSLRAAELSLANLSMARLLDLDAHGANLDNALAIDARLSRVNLTRASMRAVELEAAVAAECDFSYADLVDARWHGGAAVQCSFAGADLMNLSADRTTFMHCDFQGADLTISDLGANVTMTGTQFVNCDLRWSRWHNRTLKAVCFVGCKLYGVKGAPNFEDVVIERPDVSPAGDGSQAGSRADVLALWGTAARSSLASEDLHEEAS
jgi:uncharacterized protein YjbI with pentapeptide repeats